MSCTKEKMFTGFHFRTGTECYACEYRNDCGLWLEAQRILGHPVKSDSEIEAQLDHYENALYRQLNKQ